MGSTHKEGYTDGGIIKTVEEKTTVEEAPREPVEGREKARRLRVEDRVLPVGILVFVLFWVVESVLDAFVFGGGEGGLLDALLLREPEELLDRGIFVAMLAAFLGYVQYAINRRRRYEGALRFLAEANAALSSSLDYRTTLASVARLTVPRFADWCAVDVFEDDGSLGRLAVAHEDPEKVAWAHELQERYPSDPDDPGGVTNVLRTGRSEFYPEITDEMLVAASHDAEHLELMRRIGFTSAMIVPLSARGRTLGAITLVSAESGRRFREADLALVEDLARRAALAVDNARLYGEAQKEIFERQRAEEELRRSERSLLAAQRIAGLGNWEYDIVEDRAWWSDELFRIFGFPPQGFVPKYETFSESVHPDDRRAVRREIVRALRGEKGSSLDYRIVQPDGEARTVHTEYEVVRDGSGRPIKMVGTIQDITERKRIEEELSGLVEDLRRSNLELEQFAYVASHDLQEPLRMVSSYTQLLKRRYGGQLGEDADDFINYAVDGANRMQTLINDLLLYSRVGTRGMEFAPTDSGEAFETAKKNLEKTIEEAGAVVVAEPLPVVLGDKGQLVQLFQNLISNAIKFRSREETPEVSVGAALEGGTWLFSVRDNGIGMDPRYVERIFVIFQRLHTRSEYPGTGIGLAICKKIVERHGGTIRVRSEPGQGSTFCFTLRPAEVPLKKPRGK